jgi:hypothetical protein
MREAVDAGAPSSASQRLLEIGDEIVRVFDADR